MVSQTNMVNIGAISKCSNSVIANLLPFAGSVTLIAKGAQNCLHKTTRTITSVSVKKI
jgi:hypothetical protein